MKSTLFLRIALLGVFFAGLSFFSPDHQLQAQTTLSDGVFSLPQGAFVDGQVAVQRIDNAIVSVKELMQIYAEGTPVYQAALAKYSCYTTAQASIVAGKGTPESIVDGLLAVSGTESLVQDKSALFSLRQELINLLKV